MHVNDPSLPKTLSGNSDDEVRQELAVRAPDRAVGWTDGCAYRLLMRWGMSTVGRFAIENGGPAHLADKAEETLRCEAAFSHTVQAVSSDNGSNER